jgi:hypothetical protein
MLRDRADSTIVEVREGSWLLRVLASLGFYSSIDSIVDILAVLESSRMFAAVA